MTEKTSEKSSCPKCSYFHNYVSGNNWYEGPSYHTGLAPARDYLSYNCERCGYSWTEETHDARDKD